MSNDEEIVKQAMFAAMYITGSPRQWSWTQKEQENMARALMILSKKSDMEKQLHILSRQIEALSAQYRVDNLVKRVNALEDLHERALGNE